VAQENIYAGIGYGEFDYEEQFVDPVLGRVADTVAAYKIFGGFEFNDYFSIEMSYGKDESIVQSGPAFFPGAGSGIYQLDMEFTKTALRAIGQLPLEPVVLMAGLGYFSTDGDVDEFFFTACCQFANELATNDNGMMAQLGVEWRFGRFGARYALRLEYEWWDMSEVDASTVGLAFSYGF
jgi:hypothetical protein